MPEQHNIPYEASDLYRIRHSAAHVMAQAVLEMFPEAKYTIGPPIEDGFYYDFDLPRTLTPDDLAEIEKRMRRIIAEKAGLIRNYALFYAGTGIVACIAVSGLLVSFGLENGIISITVLATILGMGILSTLLVYGAMRYLLGWKYAADPLYLALIFGQMLDASSTSYGIDLHPLDYMEVHVVGSNLIELTGTAFVMFPLKLAVLFPGIYILERYRNEGPSILWHLIILAMITVGLAPGIRDIPVRAFHREVSTGVIGSGGQFCFQYWVQRLLARAVRKLSIELALVSFHQQPESLRRS